MNMETCFKGNFSFNFFCPSIKPIYLTFFFCFSLNNVSVLITPIVVVLILKTNLKHTGIYLLLDFFLLLLSFSSIFSFFCLLCGVYAFNPDLLPFSSRLPKITFATNRSFSQHNVRIYICTKRNNEI